MPGTNTDPMCAIRQARRHAVARWFGVFLLPIGLLMLLAAIFAVIAGQGRAGDIMVAIFSSGSSLAAFGMHNDTALAILRDHRDPAPDIPPRLAAEFNREFLFRRLDLNPLKQTPWMAWTMTAIAPMALLWSAWRLLG